MILRFQLINIIFGVFYDTCADMLKKFNQQFYLYVE